MASRRALTLLVAGALLLPIVIAVLVGVRGQLAAMDDPAGGLFVQRLAQSAGVIWVIDLVVLVVVLGIESLGGPHRPDGAGEE